MGHATPFLDQLALRTNLCATGKQGLFLVMEWSPKCIRGSLVCVRLGGIGVLEGAAQRCGLDCISAADCCTFCEMRNCAICTASNVPVNVTLRLRVPGT
jgi:hypothetical protein